MRKAKKAIALLCVTGVIVSLLAGCSKQKATGSEDVTKQAQGDSTEKQESSENDSMFNEPGTFPICKKPVTLTIAIEPSKNVIDYETNEFTKYLEEKVGVDLKFEFLPQGESAQKVALLINSGSKLPDIIFRSLGSTGNQYGMDGYFIPVTKYLENPDIAYYYNQRMQEGTWNEYTKYMKAADGEFYAMPHLSISETNTLAQKGWINKTWLDKYNLKVPETTDEFKSVLQTFLSNDCNGNGKQDEIGFIGSKNGWCCQAYPWIMNAFVYCSEFNQFLYAEDGKLYASYMQDGWRKGLEYMHDLCSFGGFDAMTFTQDSTQLSTLIKGADTTIVAGFQGNRPPYDTIDPRKAEYVCMPPLKGPDGTQYTALTTNSLPVLAEWITKDCENPEAAFRFLDFFYLPENWIFNRNGQLGVHSIDHKGESGADYINHDANPKYVITTDVEWGSPQNANWTAVGPQLVDDNISQELWDGNTDDPTKASYTPYQLNEAIKPYKEHIPEEVVQNIILTKEENEEIAEIQASLYSYVKEQLAAFVTGTQEINDKTWNDFKKECENIGVNEFLKVMQQGYDRMKSE